MKKLSYVFIILLAFAALTNAEWVRVTNPSLGGEDLYSVYFTAPDSGYIVGEGGTYFRYYSGSWHTQPYPAHSSADWKKIIATNSNTLYICGNGYAILKSVDGGENWTRKYVQATEASLNDIAFWTADSGVAIGDGSLILLTTDGGENWTQITSPITSVYLESVAFSKSGKIGIVVGQNGTIIRSTDGGANWTKVNSPTTSTLLSVNSQIGNQNSVAVGVNGQIIYSTDTGIEWSITNSEVNSSLNEVFNTTSNSVWAVGDQGVILYNSTISTLINQNDKLLNNYILSQNYPNPFNPTTTINYSLPEASRVNLAVYNNLGQVVETVVDEVQPIGTYQVIWNAAKFPSGMYFYRLNANNFAQTKKMLLIK